MKIKTFLAIGIVFLLIVMKVSVWADVPQIINYQGYLTDAGGNPISDDSYLMRFHLYTAETGGSELWNASDGEEQDVFVAKGVYNVKLGSEEPFPAGLFENNSSLYLEVEIQSLSGWETLYPRQQLTSTPYAMKAAQADGVPDGAITNSMIDIDAITQEKIADNAIEIGQISSGAVSPSKLGGNPGNGITGQILQSDGDGTFSWKTLVSADGHSLDAADGSPADAVYVNNSGNVGIGTSNPVQDLDIHPATGSAFINLKSENSYAGVIIDRFQEDDNGYVVFRTDGLTDWVVGEIGNNTSGNRDFSISKTASVPDGAFYLQNSTGNLGIGTTNPIGKLDIRGDEVRIWDGSASVAYATGPGDLYVEDVLEVDSDIYLDDRILHGGDSNTYIDFDSDRVMTYAGNKLLIDAYEGAQDAVRIGGAVGDVDVYLNNDVFLEGSSHRMGIGTTSPLAKLHIKGGNFPDSFAYFDTNAVDQDSGFRFHEAGVHKGDLYHSALRNSMHLVMMSDDGASWHRLVLTSEGNVGIGTQYPAEKLDVRGTAQVEVLKITGGSDLAEPFDIEGAGMVDPGTVLVIDAENEGKLKIAHKAYDRLVAGVVSGAGGVNPGLLMGQEGTAANGASPVALTGRIYCQADASNGPIEPGDMLTTSEIPGHAMKVTDYDKAQGAILGKAMSSLEDGQGLVLILVTLQ